MSNEVSRPETTRVVDVAKLIDALLAEWTGVIEDATATVTLSRSGNEWIAALGPLAMASEWQLEAVRALGNAMHEGLIAMAEGREEQARELRASATRLETLLK